MSILRIESCDFAYPSSGDGVVTIFQNLNFAVNQGEIVSLQGHSGSGKTSLLMLIAGLMSPNNGKIYINDQQISQQNSDIQSALRAKHIGMIFQQFHLLPFCNALENIMVPLSLHKLANSEKIALDFLDRVGLAGRAHHFPSQLSGGEQQRIAIARALAVKPALICADEPTGNLDGDNSSKIIDMLFAIAKEQHSAVLLVTHDKQIAHQCDQQYKITNHNIVKA